MSTHTSDCIELAVMRVLCRRMKSTLSKRIGNFLSLGDNSYLKIELDPNAYGDPQLFSRDYLLTSFLRKWKGWKCGIDLDKVAIESWTASERRNLETNLRLRQTLPLRALQLICEMQRKIESVLGSEVNFEELDHLCRWGPGATFDLRRDSPLDASFKMSGQLTATAPAVALFRDLIDPVWRDACVKNHSIVRGNRCVTVPKSAKTNRMIAAEPTANSFIQQGLGRIIRRRLLRVGINLNDQSVNQRLAFSSAVDNLSTLDLSCASDTLCHALVSLVLPVKWVEMLEACRSPFSYLNGKWWRLEKFSSMGNAYTFELESLIFWALLKSVCGDNCVLSVYGDDLIVPRERYDDVVTALDYFGFSVNKEKSYKDGTFFESCGKHYHSLEDVTPVYQKKVVREDLSQLIRLHNRLVRWGSRNEMAVVKDACQLVLDYTRKCHPRLKQIPTVPFGGRDDGFIVDPHPGRRPDGDYHSLVLSRVPQFTWGIRDKDHICGYALKLRDPSTSNLLPDGSFGFEGDHSFVLEKTKIWASSLS